MSGYGLMGKKYVPTGKCSEPIPIDWAIELMAEHDRTKDEVIMGMLERAGWRREEVPVQTQREVKVNDKAKAAHRKVVDALDVAVKDLSSREYEDVLDELEADIEGRRDGLDEDDEDEGEEG